MRKIDPRGLFVCILVGIGLFVTGAAAQHEDHTQDGASSMPHMQTMMADQKETATLVDQLVASFASIEAEKDPEMLKQELAEHGKLLKELQQKMQARAHKMELMHQKMNGDSTK